MITKRELGKKAKVATMKIAEATDEVLVEAGKAAERRQSRRKTIRALKTAGKVAAVAGAVAATAVAVRAGVRRLREK